MDTIPEPVTRPAWPAALAPTMFALALLFLAGLAVMVVYQVDIPHMRDPLQGAAGASEAADDITSGVVGEGPGVAQASPPALVRWMLIAMWPLFLVEALVQARLHWFDRQRSPVGGSGSAWRWLLPAACPPLRLCVHPQSADGAIWLPFLGWRVPDDQLRRSLVRAFGIPMLAIAILILPVLGVELLMKDQVARYPWLRAGLHFSTGLIWFAFAVEFLVMISVAEKKLAYCKQHWIDLVIIVLPLVSFLRTLRVLRATRLARVAQVQQVTKMARAYRMRGVTTKALRAFVLLDLAGRLMRVSPEKRIEHLQRQHERLAAEMKEIEERIDALRAEQTVPHSAAGR